MIELGELNNKAKKALEDTYPMRKNWENKGFVGNYEQFCIATEGKYTELGFNGFQVAIKRYKQACDREKLYNQETYHPQFNSIKKYVEHKRMEAVDEYYKG